MSGTRVTPEVARWISEQLERGCAPEEMIEALIAVGHEATYARRIMEQALAQSRFGTAPMVHAAAAAVPEPLVIALADGASIVQTPDRAVRVIASLREPRTLILQGVLSDDECDRLVAESRPKLERSRTIDRGSGGTELNGARTSEGTYFHHEESPLLATLNRRLAALTRSPLENGEPLQILRYGVGAEYQAHYDYFDPVDAGTPKLIAQGGQRVATLIIYLNTPEEGGATVFPDIGLEVAPVKGNAVFFSYDRPRPETLTLHGGTPVRAGEKWIATRWIREGAYR